MLRNALRLWLAFCLTAVAPSFAGIDEWTPLGPSGGFVRTIVIDPSNPSTVYAGLDRGGVHKTTDGGDTWTRIGTGLASSSVFSLAVDPRDSAVVYAGTLNGLFKSRDAGATWSRSDAGLVDPPVRALAIDPATPGRLFAGTGGGVFRSLDGGASWSPFGLQGLKVTALAIPLSSPSILYAGTDFDGVYRFNGAAWLHSTQGLTNPQVSGLAVDPFNDMVVYAGCSGLDRKRYPGVLFKSVDGGGSWQRADLGLNGGSIFTVVSDPIAPATLYAGTFGADVYKSVDGGALWLPAGDGLDTHNVQALAIHPTLPSILYAGAYGGGTAGGLFRSHDAARSWKSLNPGGVLGTWVQGIVVDPDRPSTLYVATLNEGLFRSRDRGISWEPLNDGLEKLVGDLSIPLQHTSLIRDSARPFNLYTGTNGGIFKSANRETWTEINEGILGPPTHVPAVRVLTVDPNDPRRLFAGVSNTPGEAVYRSLDGGRQWHEATQGIPKDAYVLEVEIDPADPETVYASTSLGVFRTEDSGDSWSPLPSPGGHQTLDLTFHPADPQEIYAETVAGLYRSTDRGESWTRFAEGLGDGYVEDLLIDPRNLAFYAAIGSRVFQSKDRGATWTDIGPGLPDGVTRALLAFDPGDPSRLYAGIEGGLYSLQQVEPETPCAASDVSLCLAGDRFRVEATWETRDGASGTARVVELTPDTGYLWFFDAANVEAVVKVLDGCPVNGRFWVFAGGLTNVRTVIRVTDTRTGQSRTYTNPQGAAFAPIQDTGAFADCP